MCLCSNRQEERYVHMNKTVLITGASTGIGYELARLFAKNGYNLMSEALNNELAQDGVHVSVLCPGPTQTQFAIRAEMKDSKIMSLPWMMSAVSVAEIAYSGLMTGKRIIIPVFMNRFLAFSVRLTPRVLMVLMTRYLNKE